MTTKEKVKVFLLAVLMLWIVLVIASGNSYGQSAAVKYHNKIQKERSFEQWSKAQPKIRVKAVKLAVKQSKEVNGHRNQTARLVRKEDRIRQRIIK